jgi:Ca-activated chloride channel family protein
MLTNAAFLQPIWLLLLPLIGVWLHHKKTHPSTMPQLFSSVCIRYPLLAQLPSKKVTKTAHNVNNWVAVILLLAVISLAQPVIYSYSKTKKIQYEPVDMVILVSTSVSMVIQDYSSNGQAIDRLSLAKQLLDGFVENYSGQKIGLVMLSNPPMLWLPLTTDKRAVKNAIKRIDSGLGERLTNLGASLDLVAAEFKSDTSKVVVVVTDGSLQVGKKSPDVAAKELANAGFNIYVIAMGSESLSEQQGQDTLIYEPVNLASLTNVAKQGDGQLFHAKNAQSFQDALSTIEKKHKKPITNNNGTRQIQALYPIPLFLILVGLLLLVIKGAKTNV